MVTSRNRNFAISSPILVTGAHRTGTSWVGKMLAASGEMAYISEPLNRWHRPGVLQAPVHHWYTCICEENESAYLPAFEELFRYRYHLWAEIKSLRSTKDIGRMLRDGAVFGRGWFMHQRPLIKDPFAFFSIPWFIQRWNCQVVVTIRHPAAFASSLKRLDWSFDFTDLLAQPRLMHDYLEPYRPMMEQAVGATDILAQASLLWNIIYSVLGTYQQAFPQRNGNSAVIVTRHEDLSLEPVSGFRTLYQQLGLSFSSQVEQAILTSSGAENPGELSRKAVHATRLDSRANLSNWKKRLSAEEINRVRQLTGTVAARYYPDFTWD